MHISLSARRAQSVRCRTCRPLPQAVTPLSGTTAYVAYRTDSLNLYGQNHAIGSAARRSRADPGLGRAAENSMLPVLSSDSPRNELIQGLPRRQRDRLLRSCKPFELSFGQVLCDADKPYRHAYFPSSGSISLRSSLEGHSPMEMGLIGREGMLGATLALGVDVAPMRALVQGPGMSLRISVARLRCELRANARLRHILERYLFLRIAELSQMGPCTRFHQIKPRLARWLLMTHDRAQADHFRLTHQYLAEMLGVRRSGVTVAAGALQARKLIHYARGEITVLDRAGLESAACTCYTSPQKWKSRQNCSS